VAHDGADGYTLLFTTSSVIELNAVLYKKLAYDPARELRVLGILTDVPMIMIVHPSIPAKTLAEFIDYAEESVQAEFRFGRQRQHSVSSPARCSSSKPASR